MLKKKKKTKVNMNLQDSKGRKEKIEGNRLKLADVLGYGTSKMSLFDEGAIVDVMQIVRCQKLHLNQSNTIQKIE